MPIQKDCLLIQTEKLSETLFSFFLDAGKIASHAVPGQFLHVQCQGFFLRRPISICDIEGKSLRFVFEIRGEGTAWLSQRKVGETLNILGPLGHGFTLAPGKTLIVGGGLGVPPLLYAAKCCPGDVDAVLGFRSAKHTMLEQEFRRHCRHTDLATEDGSLGLQGFVDTLARRRLQEGGYDSILACGPRPMLEAIAHLAEEAGVACQVSLEERMACGVGACLVCACKLKGGQYAHVCKDGPVFDASGVIWDD